MYIYTYKEFDSGLVAVNVLTQNNNTTIFKIYTSHDYIQVKLSVKCKQDTWCKEVKSASDGINQQAISLELQS